MRFLNVYRAAAVLVMPAFLAFGLAGSAVPEGAEITNAHDRLFYALSGMALLLTSLTCWLGAIQFWLHRRRARLARPLGAILVTPLGFLIGWLYVLAARDPAEK